LVVQYEEADKTDPNTYMDTLIKNVKLKFGVAVQRVRFIGQARRNLVPSLVIIESNTPG
jgi:hypothetical protein